MCIHPKPTLRHKENHFVKQYTKSVIVIAVLLLIVNGSLYFWNNSYISFRESLPENVVLEDIIAIQIRKVIPHPTTEQRYRKHFTEDKMDIDNILRSLSAIKLEKVDFTPISVKDVTYEVHLTGPHNVLYVLTFTKQGVLLTYNFPIKKDSVDTYKIVKDFPLDFLDRYVDDKK